MERFMTAEEVKQSCVVADAYSGLMEVIVVDGAGEVHPPSHPR